MHSWCSGMFNNFVSQASVSWTMYMSDGDGNILIVKSPPRLRIVDFTDSSNSGDIDGKLVII